MIFDWFDLRIGKIWAIGELVECGCECIHFDAMQHNLF